MPDKDQEGADVVIPSKKTKASAPAKASDSTQSTRKREGYLYYVSKEFIKKLSDNDAEVTIAQANPKKVGSKSHELYEAYKNATTLKEMRSLGGRAGDILNDIAKGFLLPNDPALLEELKAAKFPEVEVEVEGSKEAPIEVREEENGGGGQEAEANLSKKVKKQEKSLSTNGHVAKSPLATGQVVEDGEQFFTASEAVALKVGVRLTAADANGIWCLAEVKEVDAGDNGGITLTYPRYKKAPTLHVPWAEAEQRLCKSINATEANMLAKQRVHPAGEAPGEACDEGPVKKARKSPKKNAIKGKTLEAKAEGNGGKQNGEKRKAGLALSGEGQEEALVEIEKINVPNKKQKKLDAPQRTTKQLGVSSFFGKTSDEDS